MASCIAWAPDRVNPDAGRFTLTLGQQKMKNKRSQNQSKSMKLISIKNVASILNIDQQQALAAISNLRLDVYFDGLNRNCIDSKAIEIIATYPKLDEYQKESQSRKIVQKTIINSPQHNGLQQEKIELIQQFLMSHFSELEEIHKAIKSEIKRIGRKSGTYASYLLISKVIAMGKAVGILIENRFWYFGSILREIDEICDLALYFSFCSTDEVIQRNIRNWFEIERIPGNSTCRAALAKEFSKIPGQLNLQDHLNLHSEVYDGKSKFTHSSFNSIVDSAKYELTDLEFPNELNYGTNAVGSDMLEMSQLAVLSTKRIVATFLLSMNKQSILSKEQFNRIREINNKFEDFCE